MPDRDGTTAVVAVGRPAASVLVMGQAGDALRSFRRTPVAAFFTLGLPLTWLVAILLVVGNPVVDDRTGLRLAQFLCPSAIVFATVMTCFSIAPIAVAQARDQGVLKRLRGTPLPASAYLAGRLAAAVVVCATGVVLLTAVAVLAYDVEIVARTTVAGVVTLLVGAVCFGALGLAVVAVAPSVQVVQAVTPAVVVLLAFVSDLFTVGELPGWLGQVGWLLPLKHFSSAVGDQFNPYVPGSGWYPEHLAAMAAWGAAGALVAVRGWSWEARRPRLSWRPHAGAEAPTAAGPRTPPLTAPLALGAVTCSGRPGLGGLLGRQVRDSVRSVLRDRTSVFFSVGLPLVLLLLVAALSEGQSFRGMPLPQYLAPALAAYGIAVTAYTTLAEQVAEARERRVLQRLAGTPLPLAVHVAGRVGAALCIGCATFVVLVGAGVVLLDVGVDARQLPLLLLALLVGTTCMTALGLALAGALRSAAAVPAVSLGTLLPLAFVSDIFVLGGSPPQFLQDVAWAFPLKQFAVALADALDPAPGVGAAPAALAGLLVWTVLAAGVVWRTLGRSAAAADRPAAVKMS